MDYLTITLVCATLGIGIFLGLILYNLIARTNNKLSSKNILKKTSIKRIMDENLDSIWISVRKQQPTNGYQLESTILRAVDQVLGSEQYKDTVEVEAYTIGGRMINMTIVASGYIRDRIFKMAGFNSKTQRTRFYKRVSKGVISKEVTSGISEQDREILEATSIAQIMDENLDDICISIQASDPINAHHIKDLLGIEVGNIVLSNKYSRKLETEFYSIGAPRHRVIGAAFNYVVDRVLRRLGSEGALNK